MSSIKQRRLSLPVKCHPGNCVGDYVPFYFCPRSVMLYLIYRGNHPELTYRGGQGPIIHLEADLSAVVAWANENGRRWAFTLSNAGAVYTQFRSIRSKQRRLRNCSHSANLEKCLIWLSFSGGQGQNRTADTKIFSLLLYRLSYLPTVMDFYCYPSLMIVASRGK